MAYTQQGRTDEAIREYQAALRINPDYADAHYNLGVAYAQQGRTDEAMREYQAALRVNPDMCRSALQPGRDLRATGPHRLRRSGSSRQRYGSTQTMSEAHFNLGLAYGQQGRTDEAIRAYQAVLRINPD